MRAFVFERFGGPEVLVEREVPTPVARAGEVLVRVHAAALNPKDIVVRRGKFRWLTGRRFPMPMGHDWAGIVVAVGGAPGSGPFAVGDRVCGCWNDARVRRGSFAEYAVSSVDACARVPAGLDDAAAASLPLAGLTALQALRDLMNAREGRTVLIHGASGGVGTLAIQIAKALGARVVTTSSARNLAFCRSLGADEALDYAAGDSAEGPMSNARKYDAVFDVFGNLAFSRVRSVLTPKGVFVSTVPSGRIVRDIARTVLTRGQRARLVIVRPGRRDLETLLAWCVEGRLRPVVDRVFAWSEVQDAVRYLETKRARGKVVVSGLR